MNFLGHLYFSNNDISIMNSNLFGDFVKGSDLSPFPDKVKNGILLHRNIDDFIDHHPAVIELYHYLYKDLPKVTGIAVDLFFDHILALNWENYHSQSLDEFVFQFYSYQDVYRDFFSEDYLFLRNKIEEKNWLLNYKKLGGLDYACRGLSRRISFENELKHAVNIYIKHKKLIVKTFETFMNDGIKKFNDSNYK